PASPSVFDSAMLKQAEWAPAMSSSGVVVDSEPSLRAFQLTGNVPIPEAGATVPEPSGRDPDQVDVASLVTAMNDSSGLVVWGSRPAYPSSARSGTVGVLWVSWPPRSPRLTKTCCATSSRTARTSPTARE